MISRLQAQTIRQRLVGDAHKILVLYGARQVGKTTLISCILDGLDKKVLSVDADQRKYVDIFSSRDLDAMRGLVSGYDILFIDEAQRIPDIGINLKILYDNIQELRIVVTGSSALDLASRIKEPLTGRSWTFHLYPISVREWQAHHLLNDFEVTQSLESFLSFGMYPEPLQIINRKEKIELLLSLRDGYLYKDVFTNTRVEYPEKIPLLTKMLAYQIGSQVSIQELSNALRIHRETVIHYIDLLEKAFVVFRLGGFSRNLRKEITKMDKIYFVDVGMRNAVIEDFSPIVARKDKGALWENFIIVELLKRKAIKQVHGAFYFWRLHSGAEFDLVKDKDGKLHGYEFKWKERSKNAPKSWTETYPDAGYTYVSPKNFMSIL